MQESGGKVNDSDKKSTLRGEDPLQIGEEYIKKFQGVKDLNQKRVHARELRKKLNELGQKSQSVQDLYDIAEMFYSSGNLIEKFDIQIASGFFQDCIETWSKVVASPQLLGKFSEIGQIHLNIARIFKEKFSNTTMENEHLQKAIPFFLQDIQLMGTLGNIPKVAQLYFTVGGLYLRIDQAANALKCFKEAASIAKKIQYSRLLFNSVEMQAQLYEKDGSEEAYSNLINETIEDLLTEITDKNESPKNELHIAEIYQFVKKLYSLLDNQVEFEHYSKKEANEYIKDAKKKQKEDNLNESASLYRGAALCFREIKQHVDAGSCFHLAANLFQNANQKESAEENYLDAAQEFEKAKNPEKAADLNCTAASIFIERKRYDEAIDAFSNAFDLLEGTPGTENSKKKEQLGHKTAILLSQVAQMRADHGNYPLAGILFLESAVFLRRVNADWNTFLIPQLRQSVQNFHTAFLNGLKPPVIEDSVAAWGVQVAIGGWVLGNPELSEEIHLKLTMAARIPHQKEALDVLQVINAAMEDHAHEFFSALSNDAKKFFEGSPELKKFGLFWEERITELG